MEKYNLSMRIMHWLVGLCIIGAFLAGFFMTKMEPGDSKWQIYFMHKSFGALIFLLVLLRISIRFFSKIPAMPAQISSFEQRLGKAGHYILYLLMLIVPISGATMSIFSGKGLPFFFTSFAANVPINLSLSTIAREFHGILPFVLIGLACLHTAAALKHYFKDKVNIMGRIW